MTSPATTYRSTFSIPRLWTLLAGSMLLMFGTLLYFGREIYHAAPPIPAEFRSSDGQLVYSRADVQRGQTVWQSTGGMQQGSVWGHGGYLAPDWTADWLQREAQGLLARITAANISLSIGLSPNACGNTLVRRRFSSNKRSSRFVVRIARRCVIGKRRCAMHASKSSSKQPTAVGNFFCQRFTN